MARIPTPALRGQEVGSVQSQFTPTPFQNLNPDADVFGAGQARALGQAAKGLGAFSADITKEVEADDKLELMKFETAANILELNERARIGSLNGQARKDAIEAGASPALRQGLDDLRGTFNFQLPDSGAVADNYAVKKTGAFSAFIVEAATEADAVVHKQVAAGRIAGAGLAAVAAEGRALEVFTASSTIRTSILDPDTGTAQAAGLNPALVNYTGNDPEKLAVKDLLLSQIAAQEAGIAGQVVSDLIGKGKYAEAAAFLDSNPDFGKDTAARTAAEVQVSAFRSVVQGQQEFATLQAANPNATLAQLQAAVYKEPDPNKRSRLAKEFSLFSSQKNAQVAELVRVQNAEIFSKIALGQPIDLSKYAAWAAQNPVAALTLAGKARQVEAEVVTGQKADQHTGTGGATRDVVGMATAFENLAVSDPITFIKVMDAKNANNQLIAKGYFSPETWAGFVTQQRTLKEKVGNIEAGNTFSAGTILRTELGFTKEQATAALQNKVAYNAAIAAVSARALAAGRKVDKADVVRAVAEQAIKLRTVDRYLVAGGDTYSMMALIDAAKTDEDFAPYDAKLGSGDRNTRLVSMYFGKGISEVEAARTAIEDAGNEATLNTIAKQLGVKTLPDLNAAKDVEVGIANLAGDQGLPPEFVIWLLKKTAKPLDVDNVTGVLNQLKAGGTFGDNKNQKELLSMWLSESQ
jgi:hypothetical protein